MVLNEWVIQYFMIHFSIARSFTYGLTSSDSTDSKADPIEVFHEALSISRSCDTDERMKNHLLGTRTYTMYQSRGRKVV